ncbi:MULTISPECIES: replication initiation protein [unclassified Alteromonas]|uniref:replication initiation protein n=1 Tax=unclassified Alteromonas TaxID=2614992 RepID=UPI000691C2A9|nr:MULTISPECIES: replication initiation protein [unclassified Alteromonas]
MSCELTITKSLGLLDSKGSYLNPMAHKLVLYAISKVDPREPLPKEMKIAAKDFAEALELPAQHAYEHLYNSLDRLWNSSVKWKEKDEEIEAVWLQKRGKKLKGEGAVSFKWGEDVHLGLSQLRNGFKSYQLRNIAKLDTSHAIRLYEVLYRYKDTGFRILSLQEFKELLGIPEKYPAFKDLKRYVVEPAIEQLNTKSNFLVEFSTKNKGRKVTHLVFKFKLENQRKLNLGDNIEHKSDAKCKIVIDDKTQELKEKYGPKL